MAIILKVCKRCGKEFYVTYPQYAKVYCSSECCRKSRNDRWRDRARQSYTPRKPYTVTCKKCGKEFPGRWNQGYCSDCINDGSPYMNKLKYYRTCED